jgi:hypothetical protein
VGYQFFVKGKATDFALTLNPSPWGRGTLNHAPFSPWEKGWG